MCFFALLQLIFFLKFFFMLSLNQILHEKNDFERSKILQDTDLKIILLILKIMSNAAKILIF